MSHQVVNDVFNVLNGVRVPDAALLDGVAQDKMLSLLLSFLSNVPLLLIHANENTSILRLTEYHWNHMFRSIIEAETGL